MSALTPREALLRAADLTGETSVAGWLRFHAMLPVYDPASEPVVDTLGRPVGHFLIIIDESYDASTVLGIFASFDEARDHVEELVARNAYVPGHTEIQEWRGALLVQSWDRDSPTLHPDEWTGR